MYLINCILLLYDNTQNTLLFVVLGIHGEAFLNLFLDVLLYVIAFRVYPCRSRAEQSLLGFYGILTIKRAMRAYMYMFKKQANKYLMIKGTSFVKKKKKKVLRS